MKIISFTDAGLLLAQRLKRVLVDQQMTQSSYLELLHKPSPFKEVVQAAFKAGEVLIFICATGIVVRSLCEVIESKLTDPAVLVLDEQGQFVIPLLSGHEGGANHLAAQVANAINAQCVSTTANAYLEPLYTAGMGCERGCSKEDLLTLLETSCEQAGIKISQLQAIASIDIKDDEVGLIALAKDLNLPFICYDVAQLHTVEAQLQQPSQYVFNTVGVYGVAESAALVSAAFRTNRTDKERRVASELLLGKQESQKSATGFNDRADKERRVASELLLGKQKSKVATCAIGRSYSEPIT